MLRGSFGFTATEGSLLAGGMLVTWLLGLVGLTFDSGLLSAIVHLIIAAVVLMIAGNMINGLVVKGFGGAIVAAIALAVVAWLIAWLISLIL